MILLDYQDEVQLVREDHILCRFLLGCCCADFSLLWIHGVGNGSTKFGVEKLTNSNYKYWRLCMEAFLQGQDLWDLASGVGLMAPDVPENAEVHWKWKIKCGKALFVLTIESID